MLAGEYVALRGCKVISSTINKYFEFSLYPYNKPELKIVSSFYGRDLYFQSREDVQKISSIPLKETLLWCLDQGVDLSGYEIKESCSGNDKGGWGSSSALILGLVYLFMNKSMSMDEILFHAYSIQRKYQGDCSGYDFVTQRFGGIIEFSRNMDNRNLSDFYDKTTIEDRVDINKYVHVFSNEIGENTKESMNDTIFYLKKDPQRIDRLFEVSRILHDRLKDFILTDRNSSKIQQKLKDLFKIIDEQQSVFFNLSNYPEIIRQVKNLDGYMEKFGIKTSGSGGVDSLLVFGKDEDIKEVSVTMKQAGWTGHDGIFSKQGISYESLGKGSY